jgi:PAS domain-containing protein
MAPWITLLAVIGIAAAIQLIALNRQRRLFLSDPQRRRFFLSYIKRAESIAASHSRAGETLVAAPAAPGPSAAPSPTPASVSVTASSPDDAVVYVDATGECTFANQAARDLLHWSTGSLALRDVLAGGRGESDALMESLARRGLVEQHPSTLAGPTHALLEISAVAVRDRDDNLWGAAVFIRPAAAGPAAAAPPRRASSRH